MLRIVSEVTLAQPELLEMPGQVEGKGPGGRVGAWAPADAEEAALLAELTPKGIAKLNCDLIRGVSRESVIAELRAALTQFRAEQQEVLRRCQQLSPEVRVV
eukprot:RCo011027